MRDDRVIVDLLLRARAGDQTGWDELVQCLAPVVWSLCRRYRLNGADAEDVAQSVWLRLVEHIESIREPAALPGWLATTTGRECLRVLKANSRRHHEETGVDRDLPIPGHLPTVEEALLVAERNAAVRAAFTRLPPHCQTLLALLIHDPPLSYAEIGDRLGIPVGSLGPTRARCLRKLRRCEPLATLIDTELSAVRGGGTHE